MAILRTDLPNLMKPSRSVKRYCPWKDRGHKPIVIRRKTRRKKRAKSI